MHKLVELHDVERLLIEAEPLAGGNALVTGVGGLARSIFKFDVISVCEVFGYLIAGALGVRVPQMQGVWTQEAVRAESVRADPGRIGILVEYHKDQDIEAKYSQGDFSAIKEVLEEAEEIGLHDQVEQELQRLCSLTPEWYFDLKFYNFLLAIKCDGFEQVEKSVMAQQAEAKLIQAVEKARVAIKVI